MNDDYVICVRDVDDEGKFFAEPGETRFLLTPLGELPMPDQAVKADKWAKLVMKSATTGKDPLTQKPVGDVLVFIHGYNNSQKTVMQRHRQLKGDLKLRGFKGAVVSFDWPSEESALNYLEDREDAKQTALRLVDDCISLFARLQGEDCRINVHLLAHSTGAYVIREAFDDADDRSGIASTNWSVSQVLLIGGDISSDSLTADNSTSESLYRHCIRLTNYWNPYDSVLKLSNVKRLGTAPRVGRVGLPKNAPDKAVDVDCGEYFAGLDQTKATYYGAFDHSWHIGDAVFTADLLYTIRGDIDRERIPTRKIGANGELILKPE